MKTLIAYRSRYGATEACARRIAGVLGSGTVLRDLRGRTPPLSPGEFDAVLIGGSIYGGRIQKEVVSFCEREQDRLTRARVGLFVCCLFEGERGMAELNAAFPPWLLAHAFTRELLGGEVRLDRLSFGDRLLVRGLMRPPRDVSSISAEAIERLAAAVSRPAGPGRS
jgi:menaquinone-dependent protoporphyrinogen oxidase